MRAKYTVGGKTLKHFHPDNSHYKNRLTKPTDASGNQVLLGDKLFHITGDRSRTYSIKTVIELQEDVTGIKFLGVKLDNGQFSTVIGYDFFKVDQTFCNDHKEYISKSHEK